VRTRTADLYRVKRPRGLPKYAEVVQDIELCGLECGLEKSLKIVHRAAMERPGVLDELLKRMVGASGFEPPASCSRTR
jgi:hypothetical protein